MTRAERKNEAIWMIPCALAALMAPACTDQVEPEAYQFNPSAFPAQSRQQDGGGVDTPTEDPTQGDGDTQAPMIADAGGAPLADGEDADGEDPDLPVEGVPPDADSLAGIEFFQRVVGKWSGINSNTPIGFDFPMTVDIDVSSDGMLFGKYEIDADNNVLWGFNIETYAGKDVLAYRNGGYLFGLRRDSRTKLVEHDSARGYYRFCAVLESGIPVDGCNYIDARYTFSAPDKMLFEVFTRGDDPHVHWEATRVATHVLPSPFPATAASQGNGSAPWPEAAGMP